MPRPLRNTAVRRMARAAIVAAAGAAPVIAAGQASALSSPVPSVDDLTQMDDAAIGHTMSATTRTVSDLGNGLGGQVLGHGMPIAAPILEEVAGETAHTSGALVHGVAMRLAEDGPSPDQLARTLPSIEDPDLHGLTL